MASLDKQGLLDLKESIDKAKTEVSKLTGKKEHLMQQLKTEWKCNTIGEAEEKVKEFEKKSKKLESQISDGIAELEEKYQLNEED
jgi:hypothetical protein